MTTSQTETEDAMEERACLLCHSIIMAHVPLDRTNIAKIRATLPDLDLKLFLDCSVICQDCSHTLDKYSTTISDWARIEERILASGAGSEGINLEEICCLKNHYQGEDKMKMCRLCLIPISSFVTFSEEKTKMWDTCLSGLNLKLTMEPVLCGSCDETLTGYHQFTVTCSAKEGTLKSYIEEHQLSPMNFLNLIKRMNNNWTNNCSNVRIENVMTVDEIQMPSKYTQDSPNEAETCSRYNTRKRKLFIENEVDDDDVFDDDDDERDPDFVLGGSDDEAVLDLYNPGNRRRTLTKAFHPPKKYRMECCRYCKTDFESNLSQLHRVQCDMSPFKRINNSWTCIYCTLEDTDWHRLEEHLNSCDNYQMTRLRKEKLNSPKKNISETRLTSPPKENANLPTIASNLSTSHHDAVLRVETLSNNNNSAITSENGTGEIVDLDGGETDKKSVKNVTGSSINIISNVIIPPVKNTIKAGKKFTETSQCLIVMKCIMCKFNTRCKEKLYKHIINHMPLECHDCKQNIPEKGSMYKHVTEEHQRDFTRWYYWCVSCVELFRARRTVEAHDCKSTRRRVLFKSNGTVFCMLCDFESDDIKDSLDHQLACLKDVDNKKHDFNPEVIEID